VLFRSDLFSSRRSELETSGGSLSLMVSHLGAAPRVQRPCPSDPGFARFQRDRMARLARTRPDFIYLEDELKLSSNGKSFLCFCPQCLARFQDGRWTNREALVAALDRGPDSSLRAAWIRFVEQRLVEVVRFAREGIDSIDPGIDMGVMAVNADHGTYNGLYLAPALAAGRCRRVRPGHGWYQDADTNGMLRKVVGVSRLNAMVDLTTTQAQYEFETWPGGRYDKSNLAARHEVAGAIMAGCRCFTLDEGPWRGFVDEVMAERMADFDRWHGAWGVLAAHAAPLPPRGLFVPAAADMMARADLRERDDGWFDGSRRIDDSHYRAESWLAHGFALSPVESEAVAVLLPRQCAECAADTDIERWLRGGIICDGEAARILRQRGFGQLLGVEVLPYVSNAHEVFTANGFTDSQDEGQVRWHLAAESNPLRATDEAVEELGDMFDEDGRRIGASLTRFENAEGGRMVVIAYEAWTHLVAMPCHWRRLRRLVDWVTHDRAPVRLDRCRRVAPFVRISADQRTFALVLYNTGFDPTGPLRLFVRAHPDTVRLLGPHNSSTAVAFDKVRKGIEIDLPDGIPTWNHLLLVG